jgi:hypothetical protein
MLQFTCKDRNSMKFLSQVSLSFFYFFNWVPLKCASVGCYHHTSMLGFSFHIPCIYVYSSYYDTD